LLKKAHQNGKIAPASIFTANDMVVFMPSLKILRNEKENRIFLERGNNF